MVEPGEVKLHGSSGFQVYQPTASLIISGVGREQGEVGVTRCLWVDGEGPIPINSYRNLLHYIDIHICHVHIYI